jgi:molecular chaperone GrpE
MENSVSNESEGKPSVANAEAAEQVAESIEEMTAEELASVIEGEVESDSVSDVLTEEIEDLKAQVLRAHAEAQNARRRAEQDVEKARKFALEKLVGDLLPVADNLERAIAAGDTENESQKAVLEGVTLTLKSLQDTLKKYKVEVVDPEGEPFDPQLHQAMTMVPNPDVEPNTVLNVFQKGYTLNGRLVRPAMVVVSSAP